FFVVFLLAAFLLFKGTVIGYWLMVLFLTVEFLFYVWNALGAVIHGYGFLYHLANPDLILRGVFAIGYVNLFVSGYFLCLLLLKRSTFLDSQGREKPHSKYSVLESERAHPTRLPEREQLTSITYHSFLHLARDCIVQCPESG